MRILVLTPGSPFPPNKGTAMRNYYLLTQAARRHEVHLVTFADPELPAEARCELDRYCATVTAVPVPHRRRADRLRTLLTSARPDLVDRLRSPAYANAVIGVLQAIRFDLVQVEGLELAGYLDLAPPGTRVLYDAHNAEYLLQQRAATTDLWPPRNWPRALYSLVQWRRLIAWERRTAERADLVVTVSPADRAALQRLHPRLNAVVVPNGIDCGYYAGVVPAESSPTLVFTGTMDYRPNVDAAIWFCREILPLIRAEVPGCRLVIVGREPAAAVRSLAGEGVTATGTVDDVRPFLSASRLYVVPIRIGGGSRFKVLEALAAGLPVVSTTVGAEGIGGAHSQELLLADTPSAFASAVVGLLRSPEEARRLAEAGRAYVRREFDWSAIAGHLEAAYAAVADTRRSPASGRLPTDA